MSLWCSFVTGISGDALYFPFLLGLCVFSVFNLAAELIMDAQVENLGDCNLLLANELCHFSPVFLLQRIGVGRCLSAVWAW